MRISKYWIGIGALFVFVALGLQFVPNQFEAYSARYTFLFDTLLLFSLVALQIVTLKGGWTRILSICGGVWGFLVFLGAMAGFVHVLGRIFIFIITVKSYSHDATNLSLYGLLFIVVLVLLFISRAQLQLLLLSGTAILLKYVCAIFLAAIPLGLTDLILSLLVLVVTVVWSIIAMFNGIRAL